MQEHDSNTGAPAPVQNTLIPLATLPRYASLVIAIAATGFTSLQAFELLKLAPFGHLPALGHSLMCLAMTLVIVVNNRGALQLFNPIICTGPLAAAAIYYDGGVL